MMSTDSQRLFEQAFDTFKAFDNLTVNSSSAEQQAFPTSIWQILQHLLVWQTHQLAQLQGTASAEVFDEKRSWEAARVPPAKRRCKPPSRSSSANWLTCKPGLARQKETHSKFWRRE